MILVDSQTKSQKDPHPEQHIHVDTSNLALISIQVAWEIEFDRYQATSV